MATTQQANEKSEPFERTVLWGAAALAGLLLAFLANVVWSKVAASESRVDRIEVKQADEAQLLVEVRQDVKEIRDAVRRMEGNNQHVTANR